MSKTKNKENPKDWKVFLNNKIGLIVFILPVLLYLFTIGHSYNLDDELVTRNHRLTSKGISAIPEIFNSPYYEDASGYRYEYRPVALSLYTFEHTFFKESPHLSHFISIILFGLLCFLIFKTLSVFFEENTFVAFLTTVIFSIHPALTEIVASIKNREEVYAFLFAFSAWYVSLRYINKSIFITLFLNFLLFQLAILCKPTIIPFILIIPLSLILTKKSTFINSLLVFTVSAVSVLIWTQINFLYHKLLIVLVGIILISIIKLILSNPTKLFKSLIKSEEENQTTTFLFSGIDFFFSLLITLIFTLAVYTKTTSVTISLFAISSVYLILKPNFFFVFVLIAISFYISHIFSIIEPIVLASLTVLYAYRNESRKKYLLILLPLACIVLFILSKNPSYLVLFSAVSILIYTNYKKTATLFFLVGIILNTFALLQEFNRFESVIISCSYILLYILFSMFSLNKLSQFKIGYFIVLLLITFSISTQTKNVISSNINITKIESPKFTPQNVNRPLLFVEYPFKSFSFDLEKVATSLEVSLRYMSKSIIPYPLSFYYGYKEIEATNFSNTWPWVGLVVLFILTTLCAFFIRKEPLIAFSLFIYIISIVAISNPIIPMPGIIADRFLLLPVFGLCMILSVSISKYYNITTIAFSESYSIPKPPRIFLFIIITIFSIGTLVRANQWKDKITLFSNDIKHVPNSAQAHNLLGLEYMSKAMEQPGSETYFNFTKKAIEHFTKATEIYPTFFNPTYDIARVNLEIKNYNESIKYFYKALAIDSSFSQCYLSIGMIFEETGKLDSAVDAYKLAIKYNKSELTTYNNLSFLLYRLKKFEESINVNREAMVNHPQRYEPVLNIGKTYYSLGTMDSARLYFEKARIINPEVPSFDAILNSRK